MNRESRRRRRARSLAWCESPRLLPMAWAAALRAARGEQLDMLAALLATYNPRGPPPLAPPVFDHPDASDGARHRQPQGGPPVAAAQSVLNRFSALDLGHESDGSVGSSEPPRRTAGAGGASERRAGGAPAAPELQTRYLLLQVQCLRSEELRHESVTVMRGPTPGRWTQSAELLRAAYELLEAAMGGAECMEWWTMLAQREDGQLPSGAPDGHDIEALTRLRDAVNVEQTTLGELKVRVIRVAAKRLEMVERKLNPMQEERSVVRAQIGEFKWRHNPAPKLTYAERIALLTAEMLDLQGALLVLSSLQFSSLIHTPATAERSCSYALVNATHDRPLCAPVQTTRPLARALPLPRLSMQSCAVGYVAAAAPLRAARARRASVAPRCAAAPPPDESTFGKPAAPRELWTGFAQGFRQSFLAEAAKGQPECDVARAALLLAGEDDAVASRTAVPLPVEAYLGRLDSMAQDFFAAYCDQAAHEEDRAAQLDTFLYDVCRFRTPTAWTELHSPYRTYLHHVLAQKVGRLESLATVHLALLQRLQARGVLVGADVVMTPGERHPVTRVGQAAAGVAWQQCLTPRLLLVATLESLTRAFWAWEWRPEEPSGFLRAARAAAGESGRIGQVMGGTVMQQSGRPFGDLERAQLQLERLVELAQPKLTSASRDLAVLLAHRGRRDEALALLRAYLDSDAGKEAAAMTAALPEGVAPSLAGAASPALVMFAKLEQQAADALLIELERQRLEKAFKQA